MKKLFFLIVLSQITLINVRAQEGNENRIIDTEIYFLLYYKSSELNTYCDCLENKYKGEKGYSLSGYLKEEGYLIKVKNNFSNLLLKSYIKNLKEAPLIEEQGQYVNVLVKHYLSDNKVRMFCTSLQGKRKLFTPEGNIYEAPKNYIKYLNVLIHQAIENNKYECLNKEKCESISFGDLLYFHMNIVNK